MNDSVLTWEETTKKDEADEIVADVVLRFKPYEIEDIYDQDGYYRREIPAITGINFNEIHYSINTTISVINFLYRVSTGLDLSRLTIVRSIDPFIYSAESLVLVLQERSLYIQKSKSREIVNIRKRLKEKGLLFNKKKV
jgi:hypothetical protein